MEMKPIAPHESLWPDGVTPFKQIPIEKQAEYYLRAAYTETTPAAFMAALAVVLNEAGFLEATGPGVEHLHPTDVVYWIKRYRAELDCGLKEAKDEWDARIADGRIVLDNPSRVRHLPASPSVTP